MKAIPVPVKKELRKFGLVMGTFFALIFGLGFPFILKRPIPLWPWIVAALFWLPALFLPVSLKWVYVGWMKLAQVLNWISSHLVLGLLFYLVITPLGLLMRLFGRDPMAQKRTGTETTYRVESKKTPINQLEKPF